MIETTLLVRKIVAFDALSDSELYVLASLHKCRRTLMAGRDLVNQEQSDQAAYILASGWACSYKILEHGQRQIVDFQIPGDFLGLRSVGLWLAAVWAMPETLVGKFGLACLGAFLAGLTWLVPVGSLCWVSQCWGFALWQLLSCLTAGYCADNQRVRRCGDCCHPQGCIANVEGKGRCRGWNQAALVM